MQDITIQLFGTFRQYQPASALVLQVAAGANIASVRQLVHAHATAHWPGFPLELLARSAFANETAILHDGDSVPADGRLAILPPVAGG